MWFDLLLKHTHKFKDFPDLSKISLSCLSSFEVLYIANYTLQNIDDHTSAFWLDTLVVGNVAAIGTIFKLEARNELLLYVVICLK